MDNPLTIVCILGVAVGVISNTISRTKVFRSFRLFLYRFAPWFGDLVRCPYCLSHWLCFGATAYYLPRIVASAVPLFDYIVAAFVMIAIASVSGGIVRWAFNGLMPADVEEYDAIQAEKQED